MKTSDFDYELPEKLIAQNPAEPRDSSRLLVFDSQKNSVEHRIFRELPEILEKGDVLVINDTRVISARLATTEGREVFLTREEKDSSASPQNDNSVWRCLVRGGKFFQAGSKFEIGDDLSGEVVEVLESGERVIRFESSDFAAALEKFGATPLPPYIHSAAKKVPRYQTVFANEEKAGSVAAPTAGLHFTSAVFEKLAERGVAVERVTLHVGLGTFLPVKTEKIEDHAMHSEFLELSPEVAERLNKFRSEGRRIIAVGSTSCRVLESCADDCGRLLSRVGETDIFIFPGYKFKFIGGMLTNFHLPKSTLLMLVSALAGREKMLAIYREAVEKEYRFFSFGDAMLIV